MDTEEKYIIEGRKTFFIAPDTSLLPESYLEDYLSRGYETYIVDDFRFCPLDEKVNIIINTFPDSILFFFVDMNVGIKWREYIATLQGEHENILIGVLYTKRSNEEERLALEKYYLFDVGIQCGCIALEYQKQKNFGLIDKVMYANQAKGRRQNVRAVCEMSSKANFDYEGMIINGRIVDISLSHFSFIGDESRTMPDIPVSEQFKGVFVNFNGLHFRTNATLVMKRPVNGRMLHIFLMQRLDGKPGVEQDIVPRLSEKIYTSVTDKVKALLRDKFDEYAKAHSRINRQQ